MRPPHRVADGSLAALAALALAALAEALANVPDEKNTSAQEDYATAHGLPTAYGEIDWSSLPTFGGREPNDTAEVWSWDATHLLVGDQQELEIVPRVCGEDDQSGTDGEWLAQSRSNLGLTQAALGAALDLHANTIARIERGELPVERVTRLAVERLGRGSAI